MPSVSIAVIQPVFPARVDVGACWVVHNDGEAMGLPNTRGGIAIYRDKELTLTHRRQRR
jgi:hypothetical protein